MTLIGCVEGVPFSLDRALREPIRRAVAEAAGHLRPTLRPLSEVDGRFTVSGIVGAIDVGRGVTFQIEPKTEPGADWVAATLDLLLPATRVSIAADRRAGLARTAQPLEMLASIYADRLARALRRDGPILVMERRSETRQLLVGKLDASAWSRTAPWRPQEIPTTFQTLSADNPYSRLMSYVATLLAAAIEEPRVRAHLLMLARDLRPGFPSHVVLDPAATSLTLPSQWAIYRGAWDIAVSIASRQGLLGSRGRRHGVSLVVEAWPLLETLLTRSITQTARMGRGHGREMHAPSKRGGELIRPTFGSPGKRRLAVPDGRLEEDRSTVATFEAKYSRGDGVDPPRHHVFQALATAAACGSPLAVLVYPDRFDPVSWETPGFGGHPARLVSIGIDLFSYRNGDGDRIRGRRIYELLDGGSGSRMGTAGFEPATSRV
jgi:hypothetical protein